MKCAEMTLDNKKWPILKNQKKSRQIQVALLEMNTGHVIRAS